MSKFAGFNQVELRKPERSTFDLSHESRVSSRIGRLTPIFISETLPNDTFNGSTEVMLNLAPMIGQIFQRINLFVHFFFVPTRQLWPEPAGWETFITGGRLGEAVSSPPVPPFFDVDDVLTTGGDFLNKNSLADYFGIPNVPDTAPGWAGKRISALPFAAYAKCYEDYYRDRNHVPDQTFWKPLHAGENDNTFYGAMMQLQTRAWEADYFTTSLPWTQRGAEVLMPIEGTGTVSYLPTSFITGVDGTTPPAAGDLQTEAVLGQFRDSAGTNSQMQNIDEVFISASSVSINDTRRAFALQTWLERNALAGSRYNESIMAHFARKTSDGRLQRVEYLGGGKAVIQVSEVMTTAYSEDAAAAVVPPGTRAGQGSAYATTNRFSYNCEEHGFVIGILSVMPSSGYMQGWPRMFFARNTFLDYPWPSFANLGEQPVYVAEIFVDPANGSNLPVAGDMDIAVFGYQSRYSDWKFMHNTAVGDFRDTLDYLHLVRKFDVAPDLNADFVILENSLQDRVFNVSGVDNLWMYIYNNVKVKRSLPYFGTPKIK